MYWSPRIPSAWYRSGGASRASESTQYSIRSLQPQLRGVATADRCVLRPMRRRRYGGKTRPQPSLSPNGAFNKPCHCRGSSGPELTRVRILVKSSARLALGARRRRRAAPGIEHGVDELEDGALIGGREFFDALEALEEPGGLG